MVDVNGRLPDLLGRLGGTGQVLDQQLGQLARAPLAALKNLGVAYGAALTEANKYTKTVTDARVSLPPFGSNPTAKAALQSLQTFIGTTYHEAAEPKHPSARDPFRALLDPKAQKAAKLCRLLQTNDRVRAQFEKVAGAKVATDGRADGTVSLLPNTGKNTGVNSSAMTGSPGSASGMSQPPSRQDVYSLLAAMDAVVMEQARAVEASQAQQGTGASSMIGLGASGLTASSYYSKDDGDGEDDDDEDSNEHAVKSSALMSLDLNPSLQSKIDNPTGQASSVDTATMQLKRLMDKRDQMYDLYRQSMDKYSQSAQKAIDALRG